MEHEEIGSRTKHHQLFFLAVPAQNQSTYKKAQQKHKSNNNNNRSCQVCVVIIVVYHHHSHRHGCVCFAFFALLHSVTITQKTIRICNGLLTPSYFFCHLLLHSNCLTIALCFLLSSHQPSMNLQTTNLCRTGYTPSLTHQTT